MRRAIVAAFRAVALVVLLCVASAAQVVEVQGGGSTLFDAYGVSANVWGQTYDGWLGVGYQDGWRVGGRLRRAIRGDTIRAGNDALSLRAPTDLFGSGTNVLVQGASIVRHRGPTRALLFAGASATGTGGSFAQAQRAERPLGALLLDRPLSPRLRGTAQAILARRQSFRAAFAWTDSAGIEAAGMLGTGANRPFASASLLMDRDLWTLRAQYVGAAAGFRPADLPIPPQSRPDGLNLQLTLHPIESLTLTLGRQGFVQDSIIGRWRPRAIGTSASAALVRGSSQLSAGAYRSDFGDQRTQSVFVAAGQSFGDRFAANLYVLRAMPAELPATTNPVLILQERLSERWAFSQLLSWSAGRLTTSLGGNYRGETMDLGIGYGFVHAPLDPVRPFQRTLNLSVRLQLGNYRAAVATTVTPSGAVVYDASAATFLYLGGENGLLASPVATPLGRYVVRGIVRDDRGAPLSGAALLIGEEMVFSDTQGRFFARFRSTRQVRIKVLLEEFLIPGRYSAELIPAVVRPQLESQASELTVVVRRVDRNDEGAPPPE
ncbi:MAG: hypothetical protein ACO327_06660, partial [Gemmatimonadaceae bacterium]